MILPSLRHTVIKTAQKSGSNRRLFSNKQGFDSLVIGAYTETPQLTTHNVSNETRNLIQSQLALSKFKKAGDIRVFYNVGGIKQVAVVALGDKKSTNEHLEQESVRVAVKYIIRHSSSAYISDS
jgi:aminopeptidase